VEITPQLSVADGINAVRTVMAQCWFDAEKTADGVQALRHYRYAPILASGLQKREPMHDWASHGADAFRTLAVGVKQPAAMPKPVYVREPVYVGEWS
jgi:phage terminase large subunit